MAAQTGLHASEQPTSQRIGFNLRRAGVLGLYTNTQIAAATSIDDLITNINAAVVHESNVPFKQQAIRALRFGKANGDLSDSRVQGVATYEELADLTELANNSDNSLLGPMFIA